MTFEEFKEIGEKYGLKIVQINANVYGMGLPCFPNRDCFCQFYTDWTKSIIGCDFELFCNGTRLEVNEAKYFKTDITPIRFENKVKNVIKEIKELQNEYKEKQLQEDFE